MSDADRSLIEELRSRLAGRAAEGETDPAWLDDEVEILTTTDVGPVDRFLQTPPEPPILRRAAARARRRPIPGHAPGAADARLREAITWLKLALDEEGGTREELDATVSQLAAELAALGGDADRRLDDADRRLGGLETSLQTLGYALGERVHRLEDDRRWLASLLVRERYSELAAPPARSASTWRAPRRASSPRTGRTGSSCISSRASASPTGGSSRSESRTAPSATRPISRSTSAGAA